MEFSGFAEREFHLGAKTFFRSPNIPIIGGFLGTFPSFSCSSDACSVFVCCSKSGLILVKLGFLVASDVFPPVERD